MSAELSGAGEPPAPWHEVDHLCTDARNAFEQGGEAMAAIDSRLDVALAAVTPPKDAVLGSAERYRRMVSFATIADTARAIGAPEAYIRKALNGAVNVFEAAHEGSPTPNLDAGALSSIIRIAHETGQGPAYIEPIFGHVREQVMASSETDPSFAWKFGNLVKKAGEYGLGADYQMELLEEGRARAHDLGDIDYRVDQLAVVVDRLAVVAEISSAVWEDTHYSGDVLEEAHQMVKEQTEGSKDAVRYLNDLARAAHKTGQDEDYVQGLLRESLGRGFQELIDSGDVVAVHCLRAALRTCVEVEQIQTSEAIIGHAVGFIGSTMEATPRERHQLLNGLLWEVEELPEDYTAGGQIEKKPLSYVFTA